MPATTWRLICPDCGCEEFVVKPKHTFDSEFRGVVLKIEMAAIACKKCGWTTLPIGRIDQFRQRTYLAYREYLLTVAED